MAYRDSKRDFGLVSIALHWLTAVFAAVLFGLGLWMTAHEYYHPWYFRGPALHMALGVLLFLILLVRLAWRLNNRRPGMAPDVSGWERFLAFFVQNALYLLLLAAVVSGYLSATASGTGIDVFGWFELPAVISGLPNQEDIARELHRWLVYGFAALVILHIAGALKHHVINRNRTLLRMLPRPGRPNPPDTGF